MFQAATEKSNLSCPSNQRNISRESYFTHVLIEQSSFKTIGFKYVKISIKCTSSLQNFGNRIFQSFHYKDLL